METESERLWFTNSEFILLSLLLGAKRIVGIPDPEGVGRMTEAQLRDKWARVKGSLILRGYIREETPGTLRIDERVYGEIAKYVGATGLLELQTAEKGKDTADELFFLSESGAVCLSLDIPGILAIPPGGSGQTAVQLMRRRVGSIGRPQPAGGKSRAALKKVQYDRFLSCLDSGDTAEAAGLLSQNGMEQSVAADAAVGFQNRERFLHLLFSDLTRPDDAPRVLMLLLTSSHLYLMGAADGETFTVETVGPEELWDGVSRLVRGEREAAV